MKCISIVMIFFVFSNIQSQWSWKNPYPTGNTIWTVELGNNGKAWIGTEYGRIYKTTDYGSTWKVFEDSNNHDIFSICMVDDMVGYAVGGDVSYETSILKTTDRGESWFSQLNQQTGTLASVTFLNPLHGFACGFQSIARTTDGGNTWLVSTSIDFGILRSVFFTNDSVGWCVGYGKIFKTTNAGITWQEKISPNADAYSVFFLNESVGWMTGSFSYAYFTSDGGETWTPRLMPGMYILYSVKFINPLEGYICGRPNKIIKTTDGGNTWFDVYSGVSGVDLNSIDVNSEWAFTGGSQGSLIKMNSDGSWDEIQNRIKESFYTNHVDFPDYKTGYIIGHNSRILKTTDSGNHWQLDTLQFNVGEELYLLNSKFITHSTGLILANVEYFSAGINKIIKTTNGGESWYPVWTSEIYALNDIQFINNNIGFASGNGILIKTFDQGENWQQIELIDPELSKLFFLDEQTGFLAGGLNKVQKTTDGGTNWTEINIPVGLSHGTLNKIYFLNSNYGWAIGYHTTLKTTNGGNSWMDIPEDDIFLSNNVIEIDFQNALDGWIATEEGYNWNTTDGGMSWEESAIIPYNRINSCSYLTNDSIFVIGSDAQILSKIDTPTIVGINENKVYEEIIAKSNFQLSNNYPNPFNPTTKIKFAIPADVKGEMSKVQLKIYDILGNEITTLVNELKSPGTYEVEFDGTGLTSGIYFYKLSADQYSITKKMLLMK